MNRHKEKDDEAGGEGLGHLATRKRLWRDADGNIVNARRPYYQDGVKRRQLSSEGGSVVMGRHQQENSFQSRTAVPQPPPTSISNGKQEILKQYGGNKLQQDTWVEADMNPIPPDLPYNRSDFLCNSDWGSQEYLPDMGSTYDLPYDDKIFKPDTGMSNTVTMTLN
jgi:hypothetical protein